MRRTISVLVVVGLAVAVALLLVNRDGDAPQDTVAAGTTTTTTVVTTTIPPATTTTAGATTTSPTDAQVVETVDEAEAILREFLYLWFRAIYHEDLELLSSIVGNPRQVEAGSAQFGVMEFQSEPSSEAVLVEETEILHADEDCLAIWSDAGAEFRGGTSTNVHTFRWDNGKWLFMNTWPLRNDRWEEDCDSVVQ